MKQKVVVLGIGNRLMGDDGIGVRIVEAIGQGKNAEEIRYSAGETDTDYCLDELSHCDRCVIVDGAITGKEPGSVDMYDLRDVLKEKRFASTFHDFDLFHAMKREKLIKPGILITVEICSAGFSDELSPRIKDRFEEILGEVKRIINSNLLE